MTLHDPDKSPSLDEIETQGAVAVQFWLGEAVEALDECFGTGYAAKHAPAVAGFMSACAIYFHAERIMDAAAHHADRIAKAAEVVREGLVGLEGSVDNAATRLSGIEESINEIPADLRGVADAASSSDNRMLIERLAGVENELYRLANTAGDAFLTWTDPARKRGRGDGRK